MHCPRLPYVPCRPSGDFDTSWTLCGFRYGGIILRYWRSPFDTACIYVNFLGTKILVEDLTSARLLERVVCEVLRKIDKFYAFFFLHYLVRFRTFAHVESAKG